MPYATNEPQKITVSLSSGEIEVKLTWNQFHASESDRTFVETPTKMLQERQRLSTETTP